jgi:hypothetical protein
MIRSISSFFVGAMAAAALGCAPEATMPSDGGPGGTGGSGGSGAVTYTKDVQPIFMAKCAPCHTTDGQGSHNIATTYADVMKPVMSLDAPAGCFKDTAKTMPKTMGECALVAIMQGWMPMAMGCFNTPRPDPCVTEAQEAVVAAWVAAGMPQ